MLILGKFKKLTYRKTYINLLLLQILDSGELYTCGEKDGGKLGLGDEPEDTDVPQKVSIPENVTAVACGGTHTVALTGS